MFKKLALLILAIVTVFTLSVSLTGIAQDKKVFYWISHGSPADPVWTYFLAGAEQWAADTGNEVRTSFHSAMSPRIRKLFARLSPPGQMGSSPAALIRAVWSKLWPKPALRVFP